MGCNGETSGYGKLQRVRGGCKGLKGLQENTEGYMVLQGPAVGYKGLQGVTEG